MTFRLRTVFMVVTLMLLLLPVAAFYYLRIYENALVRQTEAELIAQGAFIAALYREHLREAPPDYGIPAQHPQQADGHYLPILPRIDLASDPMLPGFYPSAPAETAIDPLSLQAGKEVMPVLWDAARTTLAGIRVVNAQGVVIATSREELHNSLAEVEEIRLAQATTPQPSRTSSAVPMSS